MFKELAKRSFAGIAFGGIATFIALTIMKFGHIDASVSEVWNHMLASFGLGIYFGVASFIFEMENWSPLGKTVIHYSLSIVVWLIIALPIGWLPFNLLAVFLGVLAFTAVYSLYWTGFFLHFKRVEAAMNEELQKRS